MDYSARDADSFYDCLRFISTGNKTIWLHGLGADRPDEGNIIHLGDDYVVFETKRQTRATVTLIPINMIRNVTMKKEDMRD